MFGTIGKPRALKRDSGVRLSAAIGTRILPGDAIRWPGSALPDGQEGRSKREG